MFGRVPGRGVRPRSKLKKCVCHTCPEGSPTSGKASVYVLLASSAFILAIDFSIQRVTVWVSEAIRKRFLLPLARGGKRAGLYQK